MTFEQLNLNPILLKNIEQEGYLNPSPIQQQAIPALLEGKDVLASAQTGTGKTAAFALPILHQIAANRSNKKQIQALILAPTRELAAQIKDSFRCYSRQMNIKTEAIYGGVMQRQQVFAIQRGIDVLVATPGRLLDLIQQRLIHLSQVKYLVLDEADRMLDMGFIDDVRQIVSHLSTSYQTTLFSATIPNEILSLANELMIEPLRIEVAPQTATVSLIQQSMFHVAKRDKNALLLELLSDAKLQSVLIFSKTKHGADKLVEVLAYAGIKVDAIHGNKSQAKRQAALNDFKHKRIRVLVATDIAARGIDVDELSHVINYDLPDTPETYVHRMGRTGRAGLSGIAYSFCSQEEIHLLLAIEKHLNQVIQIETGHSFHTPLRMPMSWSNANLSSMGAPSYKSKQKDYGRNRSQQYGKQKKRYIPRHANG